MTDWNRELIMAAREGNPFKLISALDHGADLEHKDEIGWTALLWAGFGGRLEVIQILNERARCNKLFTNIRGETALHLSAQYGRLDVTKYLVEQAGMSIMTTTNEGETPYDLAAAPRYWPQNEEMRSVANYLKAIMKGRNKKLIIAARDGNVKDVKIWIDNGANIDYEIKGITSLMVASRKGHLDVVRLLLDRKCKKYSTDRDGRTALHMAAQNGHVHITKHLIEHSRYNPLVKTHQGETAYDLAAELKIGQYKEMMEYLQTVMSKPANKDAVEDDVVPIEIKLMSDKRSVPLYLKLLEEGSETKKDIRLVVVGKKGSGKTSLLKRLFGYDKSTMQEVTSTNGIEIHRIRCNANSDDGIWKKLDGKHEKDELDERLVNPLADTIRSEGEEGIERSIQAGGPWAPPVATDYLIKSYIVTSPKYTSPAASQPKYTSSAASQPKYTSSAASQPQNTSHAASLPQNTSHAASQHKNTSHAASQHHNTSHAASQHQDTQHLVSALHDTTPVESDPQCTPIVSFKSQNTSLVASEPRDILHVADESMNTTLRSSEPQDMPPLAFEVYDTPPVASEIRDTPPAASKPQDTSPVALIFFLFYVSFIIIILSCIWEYSLSTVHFVFLFLFQMLLYSCFDAMYWMFDNKNMASEPFNTPSVFSETNDTPSSAFELQNKSPVAYEPKNKLLLLSQHQETPSVPPEPRDILPVISIPQETPPVTSVLQDTSPVAYATQNIPPVVCEPQDTSSVSSEPQVTPPQASVPQDTMHMTSEPRAKPPLASEHQKTPPIALFDTTSYDLQPNQLLEQTHRDIKTMLKSVTLKDKEESATFLIWDFAGDEEFYHTHQTFLSPDAIYLVVAKLNEAGNKEAQDLFRLWMDSIHCYSALKENNTNCDDNKAASDNIDPPVVIVGTWKDAVTSKSEEIHAETCRKNILTYTRNMAKDERKHVRRDVFISNTEDDNSVFQKMRQDLLVLARTMKTWNKKYPLKFIQLEKILLEKKKEIPIIAFHELKLISTKMTKTQKPLNDEELVLYLKFHHEIRALVYFEDLPDHIVLDAQWLSDAFKCIVTANKFQNVTIKNQERWEEFRCKGKLHRLILEDIFKKEQYKHKDHILNVMEKFDIIIRPTKSDRNPTDENACYYVPCMIKAEPEWDICEMFNVTEDTCKKSTWLCFKFRFLPPHLMNHLIASLCRKYEIAEVAVTKQVKTQTTVTKPTERVIALFKDSAVFELQQFTKLIKLLVITRPNSIQIQILEFGENVIIKSGMYRRIADFVRDEINKIIITRFGMTNVKFDERWECGRTKQECVTGSYSFSEGKIQEYYCQTCAATHIFIGEWSDPQHTTSDLSQNSANVPRLDPYTKSSSQIKTSKVIVRVQAKERVFSTVNEDATGTASSDGLSKEEINFTKMGMIALNILADVLYGLLKPDKPHLRPRSECDITYLYGEHRNLNKHIPSNSSHRICPPGPWGGTWLDIQNTDIAIGDDIERIRLTRNELQHSRIYELEDRRFIELCNTLSDLLKRFDHHNTPTRLYTDALNDILAKTISAEEVNSIGNEIAGLKIEVVFEH